MIPVRGEHPVSIVEAPSLEEAPNSGLQAAPTQWQGSRKLFHTETSKYTQDTTEIARGSYRKVFPAWHERTQSVMVVRAEDMSTPQRSAAALRTQRLEQRAGGRFAPLRGFEERLSSARRLLEGRTKTCVVISRMAESSLDLTLGNLLALPLPLRRATVRFAAEQLLLDLHRLHSDCRLLHNDIKPANCLVAAEGTVHLHDFNLSIGMEEPASRALAGTPLYMAPELRQARRARRPIPYSEASDMFAMGLTLAAVAAPGMGRRARPQSDAAAERSWLADIEATLGAEGRGLVEAAVSEDPLARPTALAFAQGLGLTDAERSDGGAFFKGQKQLGQRIRARLEVGSAAYQRWIERDDHWGSAAPEQVTDRT